MPAPNTIGSLAAWYKSDTGLFKDAGVTPATANGDAIQQWNDQSGNGRHLTQVTAANRPTLDTATQFNGINTVLFTAGSSQFFNFPNFLTLAGFPAGEIFAVFRRTADPPTGSGSAGFWKLGSAGADTQVPGTDGLIREQFGTSALKVQTGDVGQQHRADFASRVGVYNVYSATNDFQIRENNELVFSTTTNTVGWSTAPTLGRNNTTSQFFSGRFAELFLFAAKLTGTQRQDMFDYCASRYALTNPTGSVTANRVIAARAAVAAASVTQQELVALRAANALASVSQQEVIMVRAVTPPRAFVTRQAVILVRQRVVTATRRPRIRIVGA